MVPIRMGRGNRFARLEDMDSREEPVREEQLAAFQAHSEAQFVSLKEQIEALTMLMSNGSGRNRHQYIPSLHELEEEDTRVEDKDKNSFAKHGVHGHQPLVMGIRF
jgi:hypothetical protein